MACKIVTKSKTKVITKNYRLTNFLLVKFTFLSMSMTDKKSLWFLNILKKFSYLIKKIFTVTVDQREIIWSMIRQQFRLIQKLNDFGIGDIIFSANMTEVFKLMTSLGIPSHQSPWQSILLIGSRICAEM